MNASEVVDTLIEAPVVTSFTNVGCVLRRRLAGWLPLDDYNLNGRVIVLTGGTSGLGLAAAEQLARCGAHLVLVGRNGDRSRSAVAAVTETTGNEHVSQVAADMGDYQQVAALAQQLLADHERIDVLIHNAGSIAQRFGTAPDGTEVTVASQVVGPFLLTGLLLERLARSAPSRVLTMSSGGMYTAKLTVSDLQMPADEYQGAKQYARAKRAQVALNQEWAARFGKLGVHFHAMHPGWADTPGIVGSLPRFSKMMRPLLRTARQGADTLVWLTADDAAIESNGLFWLDRRPRNIHKLRSTRNSDTSERRDRLWTWVARTADHEPSAPGSAERPKSHER